MVKRRTKKNENKYFHLNNKLKNLFEQVKAQKRLIEIKILSNLLKKIVRSPTSSFLIIKFHDIFDTDPDRIFKVPSISTICRQQIYAKTLIKNIVKLNKEQNRFS